MSRPSSENQITIKVHVKNNRWKAGAIQSSLEALVAEICDSGPEVVEQKDTFFRCDAGRLKLRRLSSNLGELIYYERPDQEEASKSFYLVSETSNPDTLKETLSEAYGEVGFVEKTRKLYTIGRTRIHLDRVNNLGDYMELEVVLSASDDREKGVVEANEIMRKLNVVKGCLESRAYVDLINDS